MEEVLQSLEVSPEQGLGEAEAKKRRQRYGLNRLRRARTRSAWRILADQFKSLMAILLGAAAVLSYLFGQWVEALAIAAVIALNGAIGFFTELRAVRSMEALFRLSRVNAKVLREGEVREILADNLVPGDMVILEGGDIVTADLRLVEASKLQADESTLTGESVPVGKSIDPLEEEVPLVERANMLFKGTAVTRGSGKGVVVATGMSTQLGEISSMVEEAEEERPPLEKRLDQLAYKLIWLTLVIAALVAVAGITSGKKVLLMIETSIALAVAAVPEGLPIVATLALARGMLRMARRNALINRLSAVETLGATSVICTDKTGTLTENRLSVAEIALEDGTVEIEGGDSREGEGAFTREGEVLDPGENPALREALEAGVLCNNASWSEDGGEEGRGVGDPLEIALLLAGSRAGIRRRELIEKMPEAREEAFDSDVKMMATFHEEDGRYRVAVKGSPEAVLEASSTLKSEEEERELTGEDRERWTARNQEMAEEGLRVLALATKRADDVNAPPYEGLSFLGLVGLLDPPRRKVREAILGCRSAGIKVVMVTGDHPDTARKVAAAVGLIDEGEKVSVIHGKEIKDADALTEEDRHRFLEAPILARVTPRQKLDLITLYQQNHSVVAMTGDGVNDAPALKKADIGVAMGQRGTQVAREAADMVLKDDSFSTIVAAVEQGRVIFENIRKFVNYLLSCNISEIMVVSLASVVNAPLPLLPLQILFLNLVTDVFPALALGAGEGDPAVMKAPPRDPGEPVLARSHWMSIIAYGLAITFSVLGAMALAILWLGMDREKAVTISFLTLAFAQLWHVFNQRNPTSGFLRNEIVRNPYVWGALALCTGLLLLALYLPGLALVLSLIPPSREGWALVLSMSLIPFVLGQVVKVVRGGGRRS